MWLSSRLKSTIEPNNYCAGPHGVDLGRSTRRRICFPVGQKTQFPISEQTIRSHCARLFGFSFAIGVIEERRHVDECDNIVCIHHPATPRFRWPIKNPPSSGVFYHGTTVNQYFDFRPDFSFAKYAAKSRMSCADNAAEKPFMIAFWRLPDLYCDSAATR